MPKVIILGTSSAVPDEYHENTHMAITGNCHTLLIDCVGNPVLRLPRAGIEFDSVTDIILTHFHPDHVSGAPLLLMSMWLLGRKKPLHIYGLDHTIQRMETLMSLYDWDSWPNFYPVTFHRLAADEMVPVLQNDEFQVFASPVNHLIPAIGLRIEFTEHEKVLAYSGDTEPCSQVVKLAEGADILIHEAAGKSKGHSSPQEAGEIARKAEVGSLYLIHYQTREKDTQPMVTEAESAFGGSVTLAEDFMTIEI